MSEIQSPDLMKAEMDAALAAAIFQRSPVLSRLLRFLVMATIRGQGHTLKSYSVAVEGLGKPADFDPQADSYARVHVIRLRRALEGFYTGEGASRPWHLVIDSGHYEVKLEPARTQAPDGTEPLHSALPAPGGGDQSGDPKSDQERQAARIFQGLRKRPLGRWLAALALLLAGLAGLYYQSVREEEARRWSKSDIPSLSIHVSAAAASADELAGRDLSELRQSLLARAVRYEGTRILNNGDRQIDYAMNVTLRASAGKTVAEILVIHNGEQRVIWSASAPFATAEGWNEQDPAAPLGHELFRILQPTGVIHGYERRWRKDTGTPYRCWLRFGQLLQENPFKEDPEIADCANDWFRHQPNHPVAAALKGWVMTGKANRSFSDAERQRGLLRAIRLLDHADSVSPGTPMIRVASMRAHALAGNRDTVIQKANAVLQWNPDSLDLRGAAGSYLVFQNVQGGEELLDSAIAGHDAAPTWYFIAKFAAAVSRDDPDAAQKALVRLQADGAEGMGLHLMAVALAARRGDIDTAKIHRRAMEAEQPLTLFRPEIMLERVPLSPELQAEFRRWLAPAFPDLRESSQRRAATGNPAP